MRAVYQIERVFYTTQLRLALQQRPQRGLDSILEARTDAEINQGFA
jgi:hypothetical protein